MSDGCAGFYQAEARIRTQDLIVLHMLSGRTAEWRFIK